MMHTSLPIGCSVAVVVDLVEHFLKHRNCVGSLQIVDDARVRFVQLLEQHLFGVYVRVLYE